jgi:S-adenosylmethionine-diacylglycerol 3-amino-3-carboxypropyl transferase
MNGGAFVPPAFFMIAKPEAVKTSDLLKRAAHQHKAFSSQGILERLFTFWFNSFVYNQIWEDPRVDVEAMRLTPESRILTISSGGCNVLNYLIHRPALIHAVDLNRNHICLLKLKLAAIAHLPGYEEFFLFFGCANDQQNRENYFAYVADHLDDETRTFWEGGNPVRRLIFGQRIKYFTKNFYDYAKLGYFLRFLHAVAKATKRDPARILSAKSTEEQERLYNEIVEPWFSHWIIRTGGKLPMSLYSLGIPPQQFKAMENETGTGMIDVYRERVRRLVCDFPIEENYFCWQAFARSYDKDSRRAVPDYLKDEHFQTLRDHVHRVHTHVTTTVDFLRNQPHNSMDRFVFLDSQDWMTPEQITEQWQQVARVGKPGSRIIFRTAAAGSPVESALPPSLRGKFTYEEALSKELFRKDRSAIYGGFHLYTMS